MVCVDENNDTVNIFFVLLSMRGTFAKGRGGGLRVMLV